MLPVQSSAIFTYVCEVARWNNMFATSKASSYVDRSCVFDGLPCGRSGKATKISAPIGFVTACSEYYKL